MCINKQCSTTCFWIDFILPAVVRKIETESSGRKRPTGRPTFGYDFQALYGGTENRVDFVR